MTTLGRAASLRVAYASACQEVAELRESVRVCVDVTKRMTARADAAEAEVKRLREALQNRLDCAKCHGAGWYEVPITFTAPDIKGQVGMQVVTCECVLDARAALAQKEAAH